MSTKRQVEQQIDQRVEWQIEHRDRCLLNQQVRVPVFEQVYWRVLQPIWQQLQEKQYEHD